jgi:AcrR family transcriptional regulator
VSSSRKVKAAETEAALKEAARRLFVEQGFLKTKITDITKAAGRSTGSFYEHFASKDDLLVVLLLDMHGQAHDSLAGAHPREHDLTDRAQLRAHVAVTWQVMKDNFPVMVAMRDAAAAKGAGAAELWEQLVDDTSVLKDHLDYAREQGRDLPGDPTLLAAAMGGLISTLAFALMSTDDPPYADDEVVDTITDLLLRGLRGAG